MKILVDSALRDHLKLARLAKTLRVRPVTAAGHLVFLWLWTSVHRPGGDLGGVEADELATVAAWPGDAKVFARALRDCGWIDDDDPPKVHDWLEHGGKLIRIMAADRARKKREYEAKSPRNLQGVSVEKEKVSAENPSSLICSLSVPICSLSVPSLSPTPQENPKAKQPATEPKKTEEDPDPPFDEFWKSYPRKEGKGAARKAWSKIRSPVTLLPKILKAVEKAKDCRQWKEDGGRFIPHPATWLNQERWDDSIDATPRTARGVAVDAHKFDAIDSKPGIQVG